MKQKLGRIVQLTVWNKRLVALTSTGALFAYAEGELDDGSDGWEVLTELTEDAVVGGDEDEDSEDEED